MKATLDMPRLQRSLKRFAKDFGDTNAQAIARWGVQTCRELAASTQVFGRSAASKKKQWNSIEAGIRTVVLVVRTKDTNNRNVRVLRNAQEASEWVDSCRKGRKGRTRRIPTHEKPFITEDLLIKTVKHRQKLAGIAKGGWIGAGQDIARAQKGADRINIGKNFLGYAQKHSRFGTSRHPRAGWKPSATISNRSAHSSSSYVLSKSEGNQAVGWGLKKTITWYRAALRRQDKQQKP